MGEDKARKRVRNPSWPMKDHLFSVSITVLIDLLDVCEDLADIELFISYALTKR